MKSTFVINSIYSLLFIFIFSVFILNNETLAASTDRPGKDEPPTHLVPDKPHIGTKEEHKKQEPAMFKPGKKTPSGSSSSNPTHLDKEPVVMFKPGKTSPSMSVGNPNNLAKEPETMMFAPGKKNPSASFVAPQHGHSHGLNEEWITNAYLDDEKTSKLKQKPLHPLPGHEPHIPLEGETGKLGSPRGVVHHSHKYSDKNLPYSTGGASLHAVAAHKPTSTKDETVRSGSPLDTHQKIEKKIIKNPKHEKVGHSSSDEEK